MANSSVSFGLQYTARSISLPSRLHPNAIRFEAELNKLKNWEASSLSITEPLCEVAIQAGLVGLAELYNCTEDLMQSSTAQAALIQHQNGIVVEESLERSVELLDSCGIIRDLFFSVKEHVQELQSALRRKNGDASIGKDIIRYLCFRKQVKKEVAKSLRSLKHMESRIGSSHDVLDIDHHLAMVIRVFREVTVITTSVLRSLLFFLSSPASARTKPSGWSLISKLMLTKSAVANKSHVLNNMGCADLALTSLQGHIKNGGIKADVQLAGKQLQMLDTSIEGLETGVEGLFRQLVRYRVTLLNMLIH
ncbi:uncharacterized protein LOC113777992 [Coffea eugenioides]|uniref:Uncharacterized protein n=1 Tax=Coffea arabica TaxID=13443 RepID=A0A6P6TJT0_COFAR|nr:uncharacterized protein LOC113702026 [Coffea arabica]XP_027179029.1 uncharacterized protein LOC113777992 [Coffea eugenioides]